MRLSHLKIFYFFFVFYFLFCFGGFSVWYVGTRHAGCLVARSAALERRLLIVAEGVPALAKQLGSQLLLARVGVALLLGEEHETAQGLLGSVRIALLLGLLLLGLLRSPRSLGLLCRLWHRRLSLVAEALLVAEQLPGDTELLHGELGGSSVRSALRSTEDEVGAEHDRLRRIARLALLLLGRGGGCCCCCCCSRQCSNLGVTLSERRLEGSNFGLEDGLGGRHLEEGKAYNERRCKDLEGGTMLSREGKMGFNFFRSKIFA